MILRQYRDESTCLSNILLTKSLSGERYNSQVGCTGLATSWVLCIQYGREPTIAIAHLVRYKLVHQLVSAGILIRACINICILGNYTFMYRQQHICQGNLIICIRLYICIYVQQYEFAYQNYLGGNAIATIRYIIYLHVHIGIQVMI